MHRPLKSQLCGHSRLICAAAPTRVAARRTGTSTRNRFTRCTCGYPCSTLAVPRAYVIHMDVLIMQKLAATLLCQRNLTAVTFRFLLFTCRLITLRQLRILMGLIYRRMPRPAPRRWPALLLLSQACGYEWPGRVSGTHLKNGIETAVGSSVANVRSATPLPTRGPAAQSGSEPDVVAMKVNDSGNAWRAGSRGYSHVISCAIGIGAPTDCVAHNPLPLIFSPPPEDSLSEQGSRKRRFSRTCEAAVALACVVLTLVICAAGAIWRSGGLVLECSPKVDPGIDRRQAARTSNVFPYKGSRACVQSG